MTARTTIYAMVGALACSACGSSTATTRSSPTATTRSSPTASTRSSSTHESTTQSATSSARSTTTRQPSSPAPRHHRAADSGVRLPASFAISATGRLSPRRISAPARTAIVLTITTHDGRPHRVVVDTRPARALRVGPSARGQVLLSGLANGTYTVRLDGRPAGQLVVGVTPGP